MIPFRQYIQRFSGWFTASIDQMNSNLILSKEMILFKLLQWLKTEETLQVNIEEYEELMISTINQLESEKYSENNQK